MVEELYTPEQLAQTHQQLWQYVLQFANFSAVQERNRIARELHDSLGHALTALNFQLQTAIKLCKPDPTQAQQFLTEAHRLVTIATQEVRHSVRTLRSDAPETQSLETLIESLVNDFQQTTGILPAVEINLPVALPPQFVTSLYRLVQEALNNTLKYAQATTLQIQISTTSSSVHLMIQDNGRGFDLDQVSAGYGLQGMQERVAFLKGQLHLDTAPGKGCRITAEIPIQLLAVAEKSAPVNQRQVEIGEWQHLDLNEWQSWTSLETTLSSTSPKLIVDALPEMSHPQLDRSIFTWDNQVKGRETPNSRLAVL